MSLGARILSTLDARGERSGQRMTHNNSEWLEHQLKRWMRPDAHYFVRADWRRYVRPGFERDHPFGLYERKYDPNQPRVPAGDPAGGQWTSDRSSSVGRNDPRVISDATPDPVRPRVQYARNLQEHPTQGRAGPLANSPPGVNVDANIAQAENHKEDYFWFYSQVRNKGPWDYKQLGKDYADFGNFNYGATGRAAGFSEGTLLRMAGWARFKPGHHRPIGAPRLRSFKRCSASEARRHMATTRKIKSGFCEG
jgi:hypothetical protein